MDRRPLARSLRSPALLLGLGAAALLGAFPAAAAILPDWILVGEADVLLDTGFHDATGLYDLPLETELPRVSVSYAADGSLVLSGYFDGPDGPTIFGFVGTQTVDEAGVE